MKFQQCKGRRIYSRFYGVGVSDMWWSYNDKKWVTSCEGPVSNVAKCRTFKAFCRMIKKNPQIKGKAILTSIYIGYDIYG